MAVRRPTKLVIVASTALGGYALWRRYRRPAGVVDPRVSARAGLTASESAVGSDDPVAQATAILADSDDRALLSRDAPGIERRRSEDTVER